MDFFTCNEVEKIFVDICKGDHCSSAEGLYPILRI